MYAVCGGCYHYRRINREEWKPNAMVGGEDGCVDPEQGTGKVRKQAVPDGRLSCVGSHYWWVQHGRDAVVLPADDKELCDQRTGTVQGVAKGDRRLGHIRADIPRILEKIELEREAHEDGQGHGYQQYNAEPDQSKEEILR